MTSQLYAVYEAEEYAQGDYPCGDPTIDQHEAQALADRGLAWAQERFGIRRDLSAVVDESVTAATAAEILDLWDTGTPAAEVKGPVWRDGAPTSLVYIDTMIATDTGRRVGATEHLLLHELAHVIVGDWPGIVDGVLSIGPDRHGALFTRRHLDLVGHLHPTCLPALEQAYHDLDVEVAAPDIEPASWWNLPRPTHEQIIAAAVDGGGS